jgi:hypothetical protein
MAHPIEYDSNTLIKGFSSEIKDLLFEQVIIAKMEAHPLPWSIETDWGYNIMDSNGKEVFHCLREEAAAQQLIDFVTAFKPVHDKEAEDLLKETTES